VKTLDIQSNFLTIDLSEDDEVDDQQRDY